MSVSRRKMMAGVAAALVVGGFDPSRRLWLSQAAARGRGRPLPHLDGQLSFEPSALAEAAEDFGHWVHESPWAVLEPGSDRDVERMVRFAGRNQLQVAMRGQGHSVYGQAQAGGGLVVDSRFLNTIDSIEGDHVWVGAGVLWRDLLAATTAEGLAPPVLTDYLGLSVGGVLSVGGMGGAAHREGLVVDSCEALEVITGDGRRATCSPSRRPELFFSVLGGLGQFALILRAKIRLRPQLPMARVYQLTYSSLAGFLADQRRVAEDERFDFLEGQVAPNPAGGWVYVMQAATWFEPAAAPPNDGALLADLSPLPGATTIDDLPFAAWSNRVEPFVEFWQANNLWTTPHPWSDLFLPDDAVEAYVENALATLTPGDVGAGVQLLYPFKRSRVGAHSVQLPGAETLWLYDILRFPIDPDATGQLLTDNRTLLDAATAAGGKRYPIGAVDTTPGDWVQHYGEQWPAVVRTKARYDRDHVLTPGQRIFES